MILLMMMRGGLLDERQVSLDEYEVRILSFTRTARYHEIGRMNMIVSHCAAAPDFDDFAALRTHAETLYHQ